MDSTLQRNGHCYIHISQFFITNCTKFLFIDIPILLYNHKEFTFFSPCGVMWSPRRGDLLLPFRGPHTHQTPAHPPPRDRSQPSFIFVGSPFNNIFLTLPLTHTLASFPHSNTQHMLLLTVPRLLIKLVAHKIIPIPMYTFFVHRIW
jgi:hypothetical protein